jgi:intracellular septation protein
MKFLFDFFPVLLFFGVFKLAQTEKHLALQTVATILSAVGLESTLPLDQAPILLATLAVMVATCAQIAWVKLRHHRVEPMLWVSFILVVSLGCLTLFLRDETFIKWKPTALYWAFALTLAFSLLVLGRNVMRGLMGQQLTLPDHLWRRLNWAWTIFFTLMGALNLWVAYHFSTDVWVDFKLFGGIGLLVLFIVLQALWLARHLPSSETVQ